MSIVFRIIKRIFAAIVVLLMLFIVGFFIWRIASSSNPKQMETLVPTNALCELYERDGENMYMFRQEQRTITSTEKNYGYFSVTDCTFIPDANTVQATLRYNNSTLRSTAEDYSLPSLPDRSGEVYEMSLLIAVDLTPENKDDNLGNDEGSVRFVRVKGNIALTEQKNLYNFRRMVFELGDTELDMKKMLDDGTLLAVYADIYYVGDIDYSKEAYGTLCLYDYKTQIIPVALDKNDIEALENFN